jgi:hypothetical protein
MRLRWLDEKAERSKRNVAASRRHEASVAFGRVQPASGALPGAKGDVRSRDYLTECKTTERGSLGLKVEWLRKIAREAAEANRTPTMALEFQVIGEPGVPREWMLIPMGEFRRLVEVSDGAARSDQRNAGETGGDTRRGRCLRRTRETDSCSEGHPDPAHPCVPEEEERGGAR